MIKFFRKIRQNLILENKTSKYLKYAIGEIVLVVIGILIALSINNWNEEKKVYLKAELYKNKIIKDLETDLVNIDSIVDTGNYNKVIVQDYFNFFESQNNLPIETIIDSCSKAVSLCRKFRYTPVDYTFKDMQSSGNLSLLTEDQRAALIVLSNSQDYFLIVLEKIISQIIEEEHKAASYLDLDSSLSNFFEKVGTKINRERQIQGLLHEHTVLDGYKNISTFTIILKNRITNETNRALIALKD